MRKQVFFLFSIIVSSWIATPVIAEEGQPAPPRLSWSFSGPFGTYDRDQLQRGLKIYQETCQTCHGLKYLNFRSLAEPGGPELTKEAMETFAKSYQKPDFNAQGEPIERPARPADSFPSPFANKAAAEAANNGKEPPDLTMITKARSYERGFPWFLTDVFIQYVDRGPDYVHAILTGYEEVPEGSSAIAYNKYFPDHAIAMSQPMFDEQFEYPKDKNGKPVVPETIDQYAKDVTAFLAWTADPHMEQRKRLGLYVMLYLMLLTGLLYLSKNKLWRGAHEELLKSEKTL